MAAVATFSLGRDGGKVCGMVNSWLLVLTLILATTSRSPTIWILAHKGFDIPGVK